MSKLSELFAELSPVDDPNESNFFAGKPIADSNHHLAKDVQGRPVILIRVITSGVKAPGLQLQNLHVNHDIRCRISTASNEAIDDTFSIVRCVSDESETQTFFLDTMEVVLSRLSAAPSEIEIANFVNHLCFLFSAMSRPPTKTVQALWAELFVVRQSHNFAAMVDAWRTEDTDTYDFNFGLRRLEVKSTSGRRRSHYFSYEQVYPPNQTEAFVASVFVDRVPNGLSLGSLWDEIQGKLDDNDDLRLKLDQICIQSLGADWSEARTVTFDEQLAIESLAFFDVNNIPRVSSEQPIGISEIKFKASLEQSAPTEAKMIWDFRTSM